ncbi:hypothetical protein D3C81_1248910 [compost metagenome]
MNVTVRGVPFSVQINATGAFNNEGESRKEVLITNLITSDTAIYETYEALQDSEEVAEFVSLKTLKS